MIWRARILDSPILLVWAAFALELILPPEQRMTDDDRFERREIAKAFIAHEKRPQYLRLVDHWDRAWMNAVIAADKRARRRLGDPDAD